ncbi:MAG: NADH-quinone oxidoreductase subunit I [Candidatus Wallbacteria bacterium]|nr:NADH-quinone oxidoreductase subunit I [Candidatus Wallbacteria bacterium]
MKRYLLDIWYSVISTLIGMKVTLKHVFTREVTVQYPEVKLPFPDRFRGMLFNDIATCISCELCAKACPADCIAMTGAGKGKARYAPMFDIHIYKCLWCSFCVEACPTGSLVMSKEYEISGYNRDCMILHFGEGVRPEGAEAPIPGTMPKVTGPELVSPARPHAWANAWKNNPAPVVEKPKAAAPAAAKPAAAAAPVGDGAPPSGANAG